MEDITIEFIGEVSSGPEVNATHLHPITNPTKKIQFPKPTTGHICLRCRDIPAEIFLTGSTFFSNRCKARRHAESENCKGKHDITCHHCRAQIESTHFHCGICEDDDLDICAACHASGQHCVQPEHKLGKRMFDQLLVREVDDEDESYHHPGLRKAMLTQGLEPYRLHETLSDLITSAESGCHSCSVLVSQLNGPNGLIDGLLKNVSRETSVFIENRPLVVPMDYRYTRHMEKMLLAEPDVDSIEADEGLPITMLAVRTERDPENPVFEDPTKDCAVRFLPFELREKSRTFYSRHVEWVDGCERLQIAPVADAGDNLKVIRTWLQECLGGSSECSTWPREHFRPTRLIAIEMSASGDPYIRLVRGRDIAEPFPGYATLSYCWGRATGEMPWRLTKERLAGFEKAIPNEVLPKTIADAFRVVEAIGIHYLWVDSLCIVQDDPEDWAFEAYRMGQVYNGSLLTMISGTDSSTGGLLTPRQQLEVSAAEIPISSTSSPTSTPGSAGGLAILYPRLDTSKTRIRCGPTSKRAWCYQEELLSARRLYFSEEGFGWECLCSDHNEAGIKGPGDVRSTAYTLPDYDAKVLLSESQVIGEWHGIVEQYTSRQITYHGDVFAALAGIASSLQARYESRYFAGLWECFFLDDLLWHRTGNTLDRPEDFDAPTWSWLSVKGHVTFGRGNQTTTKTDAEYVGCDVQTANGDMFGTVASGGTVRLRARLIHCEVCKEGKEDDIEKLTNARQEMPMEEKKISRGHHEEAEFTDSDGDSDSDAEDSQYILRNGPWEAVPPKPIVPPGGRLDMAARLKIRRGENDLEFATVFFDGEEESQTAALSVVYISATVRPANVMDHNGIAVVPVAAKNGDESDGVKRYRRVGFVAFWDKKLKGDLGFLMEEKKTEIVLV